MAAANRAEQGVRGAQKGSAARANAKMHAPHAKRPTRKNARPGGRSAKVRARTKRRVC